MRGIAPAGNFSRYAMNESAGLRDPTGYTLSNATISEKTVCPLVIGQSNGSNDRPSQYTVTNTTKLRLINPYDGLVYRAKDPMLGPNGANGNRYTHVFDTVITNGTGGFGSAIVQNISISGSGSRLWRGYRLSQAAGSNFNNAQVAVRRMRALGLFASNPNIVPIVWINFGETDNDQGVTTLEWLANVYDLRYGLLDVGLPETVPWFVNKETWSAGVASTQVQAAQTGIVDNVTWFAGANVDQYTNVGNPYRRGDNTHFADIGHDVVAADEVAALDAVF